MGVSRDPLSFVLVTHGRVLPGRVGRVWGLVVRALSGGVRCVNTHADHTVRGSMCWGGGSVWGIWTGVGVR